MDDRTTIANLERRLAESEARHRLLTQSWAQAVWETDANGMVVTDSPSWRAYTGQTLEEWLGYGWLNAIHPDDRAYAERQWREALAARVPVDGEYRLRASDGGWRWTNVLAAPVLDTQGNIEKWAGLNINIDARKHAEVALRESEELRRIAITGARMGTWRWDLRDKLIWGDAAFLNLWGFPRSNEPRGLADFADRMTPQGQAEMAEMVTRAIAASEAFDGQLAVVNGPTTGRWVRWRGQAEVERPWIVNGVSFDVTDQHLADQRLRASEERQAFLLTLSDAVRALAGPADIQGETTRLLREQLDAGWCYYVDWDLDKKIGLVLRDSASEGLPSLAGAHDVSDAPEFLQLLADGTLRTVRDYAGYEELPVHTRQNFVGLGFRSMMVAPLVKEGRLIASMLIGDTKIRDWSASEASLLAETAERTWAAVERGRAEAALRDSEQALAADLANAERLRSLSERLVPEVSFQAIYDEVLSATVAITRADAGTVQIYDPATKTLVLIASQGFSRTITDYFHRVDASSQTACGIALKTGERAFVDFPDEFEDLGCQLLTGEGIQSAVANPLVSRSGAPLGMLNAHWRQSRHRPNDREMRFLDLLARQAADLIERRHSERALRESEARLREFGEASQDVLWVRDAGTFRWTYLTPAFETVYGISREAALQGDDFRNWTDIILPEDRAGVIEQIERVRAGKRVAFEYRIRRPSDGEVRWLRDTDFPLFDASGQVQRIGGIGQDVTQEKSTAERMNVLVGELQHRTRNLMGVVRSMSEKTARGSADLPDYRARFGDRLAALARVQGLLSRLEEWDRVSFDDLIRSELAVLNGGTERVTLSGPTGIALRSSTVQTFALAIHELMTNALKYGALGQPPGHLAVSWRMERPAADDRPWLFVDWRESGVAMPAESAPPRGSGSGRDLIERALPYQLGAKTTFVMEADGVHCTIAVPVSERQAAREKVDA
ncbi:PAS domain-containing protein [Methylobacterium sp. M6A4_1b]